MRSLEAHIRGSSVSVELQNVNHNTCAREEEGRVMAVLEGGLRRERDSGGRPRGDGFAGVARRCAFLVMRVVHTPPVSLSSPRTYALFPVSQCADHPAGRGGGAGSGSGPASSVVSTPIAAIAAFIAADISFFFGAATAPADAVGAGVGLELLGLVLGLAVDCRLNAFKKSSSRR